MFKPFLAFVLLALCFSPAVFASLGGIELDVLNQFAAFEVKYNKTYASHLERFERVAVFASNLVRVLKMNKEHGTPVFGVTKFMDLTPEEFKAKYLTLQTPVDLPVSGEIIAAPKAPEVSVWDWGVNKSGIVTAVKDQGQCGSCWAFSATESTESAWALAGHTLPVLAPQQIVDCDTGGVDDGCNGGYPYDAFNYIIKAGGLETEAAYPYTGRDGFCKFSATNVAAKITGWKWVSQSATTELTNMLNYVTNNGPVSVCVDATPWQYYTGGVLLSCGKLVNHAVQATGFGVQQGLNVWNVRNSWGPDWGENGYIWLKQGLNLCAVATTVTAAVA